jgi:hypothetical protein
MRIRNAIAIQTALTAQGFKKSLQPRSESQHRGY